MSATEIATIRVSDLEIAGWAFRHVDDVRFEMREHIWQRVHTALAAVSDDTVRYRERGS